jgi:hypothetical protein
VCARAPHQVKAFSDRDLEESSLRGYNIWPETQSKGTNSYMGSNSTRKNKQSLTLRRGFDVSREVGPEQYNKSIERQEKTCLRYGWRSRQDLAGHGMELGFFFTKNENSRLDT